VPLGPGHVRLRLQSTHRLSTHFNLYSGLWTDLVLRNVQEYILEILKRRCEAEAQGAEPLTNPPKQVRIKKV
jgi:hypothetical protein